MLLVFAILFIATYAYPTRARCLFFIGKKHCFMNSPTLTIDIVSDVVCPWCYIGKRKLEAALAMPEAAELPNVVIRWHPFQLNPDLPQQGISRKQYLEDKFGGPSALRRDL